MIWARTGRLRINEALGFLLAALVAVSLLLTTARPADASTTFIVNVSNDLADADTNDGACDAVSIVPGDQCTLRAAVQQANATPGADTIDFNIPGSGVKTISPNSELPTITNQVTIDGYTQPGASEDTQTAGSNDAVLQIELDGTNAGVQASGLTISASNSVVRGLVINRFDFDGISIFGVGGKVEGNFIGTDPSGTTALGNNRDGVFIGQPSITVGGTTPAARNVISGNGRGLLFLGKGGNEVQGNLIGTQKDGISALGNVREGVDIFASIGNTVGGGDSGAANTIAFNGQEGIRVIQNDSTGNRILNNSIFSNGLLGIDLNNDGRTKNDRRDRDKGPNNRQNFPVLASATTPSGGATTINGKLNSTPKKTFAIQFFSNPSGEDEGKTFIGEVSIKTNHRGKASFTFSPSQAVSVGEAITATATNSGGNTSEFSDPREVVQL